MSLDLSVFDNLPKYDIVALKLKLAGVLFNKYDFVCLGGEVKSTVAFDYILFLSSRGDYVVFEPVVLSGKVFVVVRFNYDIDIFVNNVRMSHTEPIVIMSNDMSYINNKSEDFERFSNAFLKDENLGLYLKSTMRKNDNFRTNINGNETIAYILNETSDVDFNISFSSKAYGCISNESLLSVSIQDSKVRGIRINTSQDKRARVSVLTLSDMKSLLIEESCKVFDYTEPMLQDIFCEKETRFNSSYCTCLYDEVLDRNNIPEERADRVKKFGLGQLLRDDFANFKQPVSNDSFKLQISSLDENLILLQRACKIAYSNRISDVYLTPYMMYSSICQLTKDSFIQFRVLADDENFYLRIDLPKEVPVLKAKFNKKGKRKIAYDSMETFDYLISKPIPQDYVYEFHLGYVSYDDVSTSPSREYVSKYVDIEWFYGVNPVMGKCLDFNGRRYGLFSFPLNTNKHVSNIIRLFTQNINNGENVEIPFEILYSWSDFDNSIISNKESICGLLIPEGYAFLGLKGGFNE